MIIIELIYITNTIFKKKLFMYKYSIIFIDIII